MESLQTSFILGYHGCNQSSAEKILAGDPFVPSTNDYDWLGSGIYFWEANPGRALEWAAEGRTPKKIAKPCVIGAIIAPGNCLNLLSKNGQDAVKNAYLNFVEHCRVSMIKLPQNVGGKDRLVRKLDCSVINHLHRIVKIGNLQPIDTVRAVFDEGEQLYNTSGFKNKVHIQFCVCNPKMIKGVFRVTPTIPTSIVFNQTT